VCETENDISCIYIVCLLSLCLYLSVSQRVSQPVSIVVVVVTVSITVGFGLGFKINRQVLYELNMVMVKLHWKSRESVLKTLVGIGLLAAVVAAPFILAAPRIFVYYHFLQFFHYVLSVSLEICVILFNCIVRPMMIVLVFYLLITILRKYTFRRAIKLLAMILVVMFSILLCGELIVSMIILQSARSKIDGATSDVKSSLGSLSVEQVVRKITDFVDNEVKNSYNRPESAFEIDNSLSEVDYYMLDLLGFDRTHVIIFQGWGSCGQYAIALEYLLSKTGFNTRRAKFIDIDHVWAEVQINGTWFIVDPWYIAHSFNNSIIVPAHILASADTFKYSKGVTVLYRNDTQADASIEHGYSRNT